ncbi:T9SS type B sorting domain-containing protein [Aureibacter tunicatorum]|uniref:Gliding motility-associated-like protein n=1 Tax=Aureibacter tunicatorum TaxID=866807 RepID=A0AAE3XLI6_9BACT|nr:gliding motility-associated C-terminal domain-containing protein [Aureibacter tunicatorum]MDR6238184.1 gliding motility-associated-like protein [Aureibacter tunicatorum]BDD03217.1 hypothetical protein AUTU_07000 [Aureibacter tunicatorum]
MTPKGFISKIFWLFVIAIFCSNTTYATSDPYSEWILSENGYFKASITKGCSGVTVQFVNTNPETSEAQLVQFNYDAIGNDDYINYDEGNEDLYHVFSNTFTETKIYRVLRWAQHEGNSGFQELDFIEIEIKPSDMNPVHGKLREGADFDIKPCSDRRVKIEFNENSFYDKFEVLGNTYNKGETTPPIQSSSASMNLTVAGLFHTEDNRNCENTSTVSVNTPNSLLNPNIDSLIVDELAENANIKLTFQKQAGAYYEYFRKTNDNNSIQIFPANETNTQITDQSINSQKNIYEYQVKSLDACTESNSKLSPFVASIIPSAKNGNNAILVDLKTSSNYNFDLDRNKSSLARNLNQHVVPYEDKGTNCGFEYLYQWTGRNSHSISISPEVSIKSEIQRELFPLVNINADIISNESVQLSWDLPENQSISQYVIIDETNNSTSNSTEPEITLNNQNTNSGPLNFKVGYQNSCKQESPFKSAKTIFLDYDQESKSIAYLFWDEYIGWENQPESYFIQRESSSSPLPEIETNEFEHTGRGNELNNKNIKYKIAAKRGDVFVRSNSVSLILEPVIEFPNAFTPDKDGINDNFTFVGISEVEEFQLYIYNRWGELIFNSEDRNIGWQGYMSDGIKAPAGAYSYSSIIKANGEIYEKKGLVNLIR